MLPAKMDPRWKALVVGNEQYAVKGLAVRMMLTRVRLIGARKEQGSLQQAIDMAYDFFAKNAEAARDDVQVLFGAKP